MRTLIFSLLMAALLCSGFAALAESANAASGKKSAATAQSKTKKTTKPTAKKPKAPKAAPKDTIANRLAALKLRTSKQVFKHNGRTGTNLYVDVPPTRLPSRPGTRPPKRMNNWWTVTAVRWIEPAPDGTLDPGVRNALELIKAMTEKDSRDGGLIVVFLDTAFTAYQSSEKFAELVYHTKRIVTHVECGGMGDPGAVYDCKDRFVKWGQPRMIGYQGDKPRAGAKKPAAAKQSAPKTSKKK